MGWVNLEDRRYNFSENSVWGVPYPLAGEGFFMFIRDEVMKKGLDFSKPLIVLAFGQHPA